LGVYFRIPQCDLLFILKNTCRAQKSHEPPVRTPELYGEPPSGRGESDMNPAPAEDPVPLKCRNHRGPALHLPRAESVSLLLQEVVGLVCSVDAWVIILPRLLTSPVL
jgi:hypothetical protein